MLIEAVGVMPLAEEMAMRTILVGFDGSMQAKRAARAAAALATPDEAALRLVEVVPPLVVPGDLPAVPVVSMIEDQLKAAEEEVTTFAKELEGTGARVSTEVVRGAPAAELIRLADKDPTTDLVVVGRTGKGALARAVIGSVSSRLAHRCEKPILIVP
jgi:nucleotide-binding universal stress UspA family protein